MVSVVQGVDCLISGTGQVSSLRENFCAKALQNTSAFSSDGPVGCVMSLNLEQRKPASMCEVKPHISQAFDTKNLKTLKTY